MLRRVLAALLACAFIPPASATEVAQPRVGEIPPFDLGTRFGGDAIDLRDYRGKVVILTFWASWCGPCLKELPILGRFQEAVGRDALEVIAVNHKESRRDFLGLVRGNRELRLTWVLDERGRINDSYGVRALPNMFIIDREGRVAAVHRGYSEATLPRIIEDVMSVLPADVLARPAAGG
ncbi:MAG TPA: TlpA disulfide reductase family protein [Luteimonas sp.]